jgi:hypothetical protein
MNQSRRLSVRTRRQVRERRSRTVSVAEAGEPMTKPKKGPKSRVAEKPAI